MSPTKLILSAAFLAIVALTVSCATVDAKLDQADKAITDAENTVDRATDVVEKGIKTANRAVNTVERTKNRVVDTGKDLKNRVENLALAIRIVVKKGDTLWGIASRAYSGTPQAPAGEGGYLWPLICAQNKISDCHLIEVGDIISYLPADRLHTVPAAELAKYKQMAFDAP